MTRLLLVSIFLILYVVYRQYFQMTKKVINLAILLVKVVMLFIGITLIPWYRLGCQQLTRCGGVHA